MMNHGIYRLHGMMLLAVAALGTSLAAFAANPAITVSAQQRYPWNGLVDLQFTITGTSGMKYDTSFTAKDMVGGTNITMATIRKSDGTAANVVKEQLLPGTYNWVWDATADLPNGFECERVTVTATAGITPFPYSVKFNANGGTGTMADESFTYGTAKALTANAFTRTEYTFQGWATSASGAKVYNDKQSVSNLATSSGEVVNLYAVWKVTHGKVQLWQGGPYWAETNIGAEAPEESGYYFWWGDTVGYTRKGNAWVAADGSSSNFSFSSANTPTYGKDIDTLDDEGWLGRSGLDYVLIPKYDAAHVHWGGAWRMPTYQELKTLNDNCDWTLGTLNGVTGYTVKGRGAYASASIFLPCAGYGDGTSHSGGSGSGDYWSSVPYSDINRTTAWEIFFNQSATGHFMSSYGRREHGYPIRPVQ